MKVKSHNDVRRGRRYELRRTNCDCCCSVAVVAVRHLQCRTTDKNGFSIHKDVTHKGSNINNPFRVP